VATPDDLPSRPETRYAYAISVLASLVWVACVIPGVRLADPTRPDDLATPMARGALLLVPALLLLVACPIAAVLSNHPLGLRALLAWGDAFVTGYTAVALAVARPGRVVIGLVPALGVLTLVSVRDAIRIGRASAVEPPVDMPPRYTDVRLACAILALLAPASLLASGTDERASWLAPFAFVAVGALGERFARTVRSLRRTFTACLAILGAHLVIAVRFSLVEGSPKTLAWTWAGRAAFGLSCAILVVSLVWLASLRRPPREAVA
jgi:hypothetical protein